MQDLHMLRNEKENNERKKTQDLMSREICHGHDPEDCWIHLTQS